MRLKKCRTAIFIGAFFIAINSFAAPKLAEVKWPKDSVNFKNILSKAELDPAVEREFLEYVAKRPNWYEDGRLAQYGINILQKDPGFKEIYEEKRSELSKKNVHPDNMLRSATLADCEKSFGRITGRN